jgi:hypothetical protein
MFRKKRKVSLHCHILGGNLYDVQPNFSKDLDSDEEFERNMKANLTKDVKVIERSYNGHYSSAYKLLDVPKPFVQKRCESSLELSSPSAMASEEDGSFVTCNSGAISPLTELDADPATSTY